MTFRTVIFGNTNELHYYNHHHTHNIYLVLFIFILFLFYFFLYVCVPLIRRRCHCRCYNRKKNSIIRLCVDTIAPMTTLFLCDKIQKLDTTIHSLDRIEMDECYASSSSSFLLSTVLLLLLLLHQFFPQTINYLCATSHVRYIV